MSSFDIVNRIDLQEVDNAVNLTKKVIATRYDFRKSKTALSLNKKEKRIEILTEDEMKLKAVEDELIGHLVRRKTDPKALAFPDVEQASQGMIRRRIPIREGIDTDTARKIVKLIKGLKLKVQAQIQDQQLRVSGKKIDDLQTIIAMLKQKDIDIPLQFVNLKS